MNKQEALEAILEQCRTHEQPHEEVRRADTEVVYRRLLAAAELLGEDEGTDDAEVYLVQIAAAALYLLVDEVEIVAGRTLEAWLAEQKLTSTTIQSWGGQVIACTVAPANGVTRPTIFGRGEDGRPIMDVRTTAKGGN